MTLHKSDALVLKTDRSGESSLLVKVFLRENGRQNLLAKGARKTDSVLVGKLEPFSEVQLLYYQKSDDNLGVISQVTQIRSNNDLANDIRRISFASAVIEAIDQMVYQGEGHSRIFDLIKGTFYMLNYAQPKKLEFFFLVYLIKLLDLIGLSPQFENCVKTGDPVDEEEILFSVEDGGVVGSAVADHSKSYFKLDRGILAAINSARSADIDKMKGLDFTDKQKTVIKDLIFAFMSYHTESKPSFSSLSFLTKLSQF